MPKCDFNKVAEQPLPKNTSRGLLLHRAHLQRLHGIHNKAEHRKRKTSRKCRFI